MATTTVKAERPPKTRCDHIFFQAFAALIAIVVFVGFAPTFFLRGMLKIPAFLQRHGPVSRPPLLLPVVIVHGTIFSSWILLLLAQTFLITAHRVKMHRRLGLAGFVLASLVVLAGIAVVSEATARLFPPGDPGVLFFACASLFELLGFALLAAFGYIQRRNSPAHKRLMLLATICLLPQALIRWPVWPSNNMVATPLCCCALVALIACYDLWSMGKIRLATFWGGAISIITGPLVSNVFFHNSVSFHVALIMQALGRHLL